jgi:hypothetical protein
MFIFDKIFQVQIPANKSLVKNLKKSNSKFVLGIAKQKTGNKIKEIE